MNMKKIIASIFFLSLISCNPEKGENHTTVNRNELVKSSPYYDQQYRTYTLEGCEYIVVSIGNQQWGSHKGNCKNPIHKDK